MSSLKFKIETRDITEDLKFLENSISEFNGSALAGNRLSLNIIHRNAAGEIIAGVSGFTNWGWLYIRLLWVSNANRKQGLGAQLMAAAEAEAVLRQCHCAWVDTFSPEAKGFYESLNYSQFGILKQFPKNHSRFFLFKNLD